MSFKFAVYSIDQKKFQNSDLWGFVVANDIIIITPTAAEKQNKSVIRRILFHAEIAKTSGIYRMKSRVSSI